MLLTCVTVDKMHPSARQALGDCCDMHRNIMRLFPSQSRADGRILYRVLEERGQTRLYITSDTAPDLSQAAWLMRGQDMRRLELTPVTARFAEGTVWLFDLLAHPCKKVYVGRHNSARVFLQTPQERQSWLARQGEKNGFAVCACREDRPYDIRGRRHTGTITARVVRFTGVLRVTDAAVFRRGYENGIGPEKAYGLGMLLLRRG